MPIHAAASVTSYRVTSHCSGSARDTAAAYAHRQGAGDDDDVAPVKPRIEVTIARQGSGHNAPARARTPAPEAPRREREEQRASAMSGGGTTPGRRQLRKVDARGADDP